MIRNIMTICCLLLVMAKAYGGQRSDSTIRHVLEAKAVEFTNNNSVILLTNGEEKFDDLFKAIRQARHHVHLEYFNFRNDSIASLLFDLLKTKVKEGKGSVRRLRQRLQQPTAEKEPSQGTEKCRNRNIRI